MLFDDPQKLEIIIWDVQHGNAIYVKTPNGTHICFDIGSGSYGSGQTFSPLAYLKEKWDVGKLDYLVVSHPHADHLSDISMLFKEQMKPVVFARPRGLSEEFIREANQNKFTEIIDLYLELDTDYSSDVLWENNPRNPTKNGGVYIENFSQKKPGMNNINNYSFVSIMSFSNQKIIIPGDIENVGWNALLEKEEFLKAITGTTIFVASHHGRDSGFSSDLFEYIKPDIVIISDGAHSDTSATNIYYNHSEGSKVKKRSTDEEKTRYVLTTRNDYAIYIAIEYDSIYGSSSRIITIG